MKKHLGFTLMELMITVAIVSLLAAVAYPSYLEQVKKSRRADAQSLLMNVAARQQQALLDSRAFADSVSALSITVTSSVSSFYTISMVVGTGTVPAFTVTATPLGSQTSDSCGALSVNQLGTKSPATGCW